MSVPREIIDLTQVTDEDSMDMTCDDLFPPPVDGEDGYRVERILAVTKVDGIPMFLVKWFGYPIVDSTWEPKYNLTNCQDALIDFNLTRQQH